MIPYIHLSTISLGPLTLHVWGLFVSLAWIVGILVARRAARARSLDKTHVFRVAGWVLLAAFVGARLFHVFFYDWPYYRANPGDIVKFWEGGLASFGGYIGAATATTWYLLRHRLPFLLWADVLIFALPIGIAIGRMGPFFGHLHPGIQSTLFFAVAYPEGARLDADLLLSINGLLLALLFWIAARKLRRDGFFLTFFLLWYGVTRFLLDFVRATDIPMPDARYWGLTPAQYGAIAFIIIGIYLHWKLRNSKTTAAEN